MSLSNKFSQLPKTKNQKKRKRRSNAVKSFLNNPIFKALVQELGPSLRKGVVDTLAVSRPELAAGLDSSIELGTRVRKRVKKQKRGESSPSSLVTQAITRSANCASEFIHAVNNPMTYSSQICLPLAPLVPSFKTSMKKDITFTAGTNGFAFAILAPCLSSETSLWYSNSAYTGVVTADDAGVGVSSASTGGLFTTSQFLTPLGENDYPLTGRIVMVAFQVTPLATLMNRKGIMKLFQHPSRGSVAGLSTSDVSAWNTTQRYDIATTGNETVSPQLVSIARSPDEFAYENASTSAIGVRFPWCNEFDGGGGIIGSPIMGVLIDGANVGDSFNISVKIYAEYAGPVVGSYSTLGALNTEAYDMAASILETKNFELSQGLRLL